MAVVCGFLSDQDEFPDTAVDELSGLAQYVLGWFAAVSPADAGDGAEAAFLRSDQSLGEHGPHGNRK